MRVFVFALLAAFVGFVPQQSPRVSAEDLRKLSGARWTGTLTYLDYRSNKPTSIPSNLTVTQAGGDENAWVFEYEYPDEPKANGKQTLKIEAETAASSTARRSSRRRAWTVAGSDS